MQADAYAGFNGLYKPSRKPGPIIEVGCWAHAPRDWLRKVGEDVTETLELVPRIQHVREKFSCRGCEAISQPTPVYPISRGRAGPCLWHTSWSPNKGCTCRSTARAELTRMWASHSTFQRMANWVGAAAATLMPLVEVIKAHVIAGARIHAR